MLAADVDISDFESRHITGWLSLALPPGLSASARWAMVILDRGEAVRVAVSGQSEPVGLDLPAVGDPPRPAALRSLRQRLDVNAVIVARVDAIPRMVAEIDQTLRFGDDYTRQWLTVWRIVKRELGRTLWVEPRVLDLIPAVNADALQTSFDLLIPDGTSMLGYVIADDRKSILASVIAGKRGGDIAQLGTHLAISDELPERGFAQNWRAQLRRATQAAEGRFGPASLGVFMERAAFYRILTGPPTQLSVELASRNVVIDPCPAWLKGLLGGASAVAAASAGARALARFVPGPARRAAEAMAEAAQERLRDSGMHPLSVLGFDPIELWHSLRGYYRVESQSGS